MLKDSEYCTEETINSAPTTTGGRVGSNSEYQPSRVVAFALGLPIIRGSPIARRPKEFSRFLKYAMVGVIGMAVDFAILNLLHKGFGLPVWLANIFSFSAAVISNFTWNRLWTFPESRQRPILSQLAQFALVNVVGLGINEMVLLGVLAGIKSFVPDPWDYNLAKAFAIGVVLFWNYFINRFWTYKGID